MFGFSLSTACIAWHQLTSMARLCAAMPKTFTARKGKVSFQYNDEDDDCSDGVDISCLGEAGGEERVYVNTDARERPHVRVVFNLSRDVIMASYDKEVGQLLETFDKLEIPKTQEGISEHLFGAKNRLVQTLVRRLKHEPRDIHKFLATVYFAVELGLPSKRLQQHPNTKFDEAFCELISHIL